MCVAALLFNFQSPITRFHSRYIQESPQKVYERHLHFVSLEQEKIMLRYCTFSCIFTVGVFQCISSNSSSLTSNVVSKYASNRVHTVLEKCLNSVFEIQGP